MKEYAKSGIFVHFIRGTHFVKLGENNLRVSLGVSCLGIGFGAFEGALDVERLFRLRFEPPLVVIA